MQRGAEEQRLARHARRCHSCRRRARELGIEPLSALGALRQKAAALLPLPWLLRRSGGDGSGITGLFGSGASAAPLAERAAALVAVAALAGAGGAALGTGALRGDREGAGDGRVAAERSAAGTEEQQRGATGAATDGERAGARRASGRRASGPAGGRAGGSTSTDARPESGSQSAVGPARQRPAVGRSRRRGLPALPRTDAGPESAAAAGAERHAARAAHRVTLPRRYPTQLPAARGASAVPLPDVEDVTDALPDVLP